MSVIVSYFSPGAIAGIVIAVLFVVAVATVIVVIVSVYAWRQKKSVEVIIDGEMCVTCSTESGNLLEDEDTDFPDGAQVFYCVCFTNLACV